MRKEEAEYIGKGLAEFPADQLSPMLEIGSSTIQFRTVEKPHIAREIHERLDRQGVRIVTTDLKAEGVEISGDIFDPVVQAKLRAVGAKSVLCCNIFEHIEDRISFAKACDSVLSPGGLMIVSVPQSYPFHPDPLDTYYRPTPTEIGKLFPGYSVLAAASVRSTSYLKDEGVGEVLRAAIKSILFVGGRTKTKARAHRLLWAFRPYRSAVAVLRKPG